jgi:hypothetical protein
MPDLVGDGIPDPHNTEPLSTAVSLTSCAGRAYLVAKIARVDHFPVFGDLSVRQPMNVHAIDSEHPPGWRFAEQAPECTPLAVHRTATRRRSPPHRRSST